MTNSAIPGTVTADVPRVCLLTETFYPIVGGGETHARLLAWELRSLAVPIFIVTRRTSRKLASCEEVDGIPVHRIGLTGMKRWGKYLMIPFTLVELARLRGDYDLIYVCGLRVLGAPAVTAAKFLRKSCILRAESQGEMSGKYASAYKRLPPGISTAFSTAVRLRNRVLRRADAFVSISDPVTTEMLECGIQGDRVIQIPNGIDSEVFHPVTADIKRRLRHDLGLPNGFLAAYTGKLNQGKGLEHLINAWKTVAQVHADALLVLVGSGAGQTLSVEDSLRRMVRENGLESRVVFTGYVENVNEYLQASDLFVFPTENEAFGISLVEAMSCGLPAVASRVGGIPGIVRHLENGVLVEPGDPSALAEEILRLIRHPSLGFEIGLRGRETACLDYSIRAVAERHLQLFRSVCREKTC